MKIHFKIIQNEELFIKIYNKDKEKEVVIPILDFIKYYKTIAHIPNPVIKNDFMSSDNYEDYDIESYRNIRKTELTKNEFKID